MKFLKQSAHELSKVVWPKQKEVAKYLAAVIIIIIIVGTYIALLDTGLSYVKTDGITQIQTWWDGVKNPTDDTTDTDGDGTPDSQETE